MGTLTVCLLIAFAARACWFWRVEWNGMTDEEKTELEKELQIW